MYDKKQLVTELLHLFNHLVDDIHRLENLIMANQDELTVQLNNLNTNLNNMLTQISKARSEIQDATQAQLDAIADLQEQIASSSVSPALQAAFDNLSATTTQLQTSVQGLDDINPDAPAPVEPVV
jgi:predicted  nucleic acid-binding Zn-ribbon protein